MEILPRTDQPGPSSVVIETPTTSSTSDDQKTTPEAKPLLFSINNILNNIGNNPTSSNSRTVENVLFGSGFNLFAFMQAMPIINAQQVENILSSLMNRNGECDINVTKQPYVIVQHERGAKKNMTRKLTDQGHTVFQTDLYYTGVSWNTERDITSTLALATKPGVQFVFLPFTIHKWSRKIDRCTIKNGDLAEAVFEKIDWFDCVVEKFRYRQLFDHLDLRKMNVGVRVHCYEGEAIPQATKIKNEFCWALQYKAIRNKLFWKVTNYKSDAECDITLVVTLSPKCFMTGIQVRERQRRLPVSNTIEGINLMWSFLQAADSFKVLDFKKDGKSQRICLLTYKDNIAGFFLVKIITPSGPIEEECWVPLKWEKKYMQRMFEKKIEGELAILGRVESKVLQYFKL
ncbi:unnamed protein product [Caenorhabditis brenneri]